jgi:hypothetical protein
MKSQTYSGKAFPDPSWCVPRTILEGCCILSGHAKIGKSFLVLGIALARHLAEAVARKFRSLV